MIEVLQALQAVASESGKSPAAIADESGLARMTVVNILNGKNENPSLQTLIDISASLNCSLDLVSGDASAVVPASVADDLRDELASMAEQQDILQARLSDAQQHIQYLECDLSSKTRSLKTMKHLFCYVVVSLCCAVLALTLIDLANVDNGWFHMPLFSRLAIVLFMAVVIVLSVLTCMVFINLYLQKHNNNP